jgi:hypothetical protein
MLIISTTCRVPIRGPSNDDGPHEGPSLDAESSLATGSPCLRRSDESVPQLGGVAPSPPFENRCFETLGRTRDEAALFASGCLASARSEDEAGPPRDYFARRKQVPATARTAVRLRSRPYESEDQDLAL